MQLGCSPLCSVGMPDWGMCQPVDTGSAEGKPDWGMSQLGTHCVPAMNIRIAKFQVKKAAWHAHTKQISRCTLRRAQYLSHSPSANCACQYGEEYG